MGCTASLLGVGVGVGVGVLSKKKKKKRRNIPQVAVFAPSMLLPCQSHLLHTTLKGLVPKDILHTITSLRNQIALIAEDTPLLVGSSATNTIDDLHRLLQQYLSLLLGLTSKEHGLQNSVDFKWKSTSDTKQETCTVANSWFEVLSVLQMMANLTLRKANLKIIAEQSSPGETLVSAECIGEAIELLLRGAGYLDFCIRDVLVRLPPDITSLLPKVWQKGVMEATINQALAQGTEVQLGLAIGSQNTTLSVKRRLSCELVSYLGQAHYCLSNAANSYGDGKKHLLFIKWKYLEGKAAAYYYHGLMLDKGAETSCHINALSCFLAAEQVLSESKKACLSFCLADPVTRAPPPWGVMKHLNKKIHETATNKFQMHGYLLDQDKYHICVIEKFSIILVIDKLDAAIGIKVMCCDASGVGLVAELPEFQVSLRPEEYELPVVDSAWDSDNINKGEPLKLKQHLKDDDDEEEEDHTGSGTD